MVFPCILLQYGEICAKELKVHEQVLTTDVICVIIKEIQVEQLEKPETTYNLEVEDFHTYYISDSEVLVHNMCAKSNSPQSPKKLNDQYLKKNNVDAHEFKRSILGKKAQISRYDIYVDTVDDYL